MPSIDHVVLAVRDLDTSSERLLAEHGLPSVAGGRHPRWGTANRVVPLGGGYVEILAVVDEEAAAASGFGRSMRRLTANGDRWFTVCIAVDNLDRTADRLGLEVVTGERERPDGFVLRWRSCGLEDPKRADWLPFFIEWDVPPEEHPGRVMSDRVPAAGIAWVEMGDDGRLGPWLGEDGRDLPIRIVDGEPGVHAVGLRTPDGSPGGGEIVLR